MLRSLLALLAAVTCLGPWLVAQTPPPDQSSESPSTLGTGDVVRVKIWREPDLSGEFPVSPAGEVTLPKLGAVALRDRSAAHVQQLLVERYRAFLRNPSIEVMVLRRITVAGAVRNPGVYTVDPTVTVSDALALAGGPAPNGKVDRVHIVRNGARLAADLRGETVLTDTPIQSGDQLYVPQRSWLSRNPWIVAAGLTATVSLARALILHD